MFIKEVENAEILKKNWFRRIFLGGIGLQERTRDPRTLNKFIIEIMNPYGSGETYKQNDKQNDKLNLNINNDIQKTKKLIKENIQLSQNIYDKMEKGDKKSKVNFLPKMTNPNIVKLFGLENKEHKDDTFYTMEDIGYKYTRKQSDSDESQMDLNVCSNNSIV
jgi:hypothetical protein